MRVQLYVKLRTPCPGSVTARTFATWASNALLIIAL